MLNLQAGGGTGGGQAACWHPVISEAARRACARRRSMFQTFSRSGRRVDGDSDSALRARGSVMASGMMRWRFVPSRELFCNGHGTMAPVCHRPGWAGYYLGALQLRYGGRPEAALRFQVGPTGCRVLWV